MTKTIEVTDFNDLTKAYLQEDGPTPAFTLKERIINHFKPGYMEQARQENPAAARREESALRSLKRAGIAGLVVAGLGIAAAGGLVTLPLLPFAAFVVVGYGLAAFVSGVSATYAIEKKADQRIAEDFEQLAQRYSSEVVAPRVQNLIEQVNPQDRRFQSIKEQFATNRTISREAAQMPPAILFGTIGKVVKIK